VPEIVVIDEVLIKLQQKLNCVVFLPHMLYTLWFVLLDICTAKCRHSERVTVIVSWSIRSAAETVCCVLKLVPHSICTCPLLLVAMPRCFLGKISAKDEKECLLLGFGSVWLLKHSFHPSARNVTYGVCSARFYATYTTQWHV